MCKTQLSLKDVRELIASGVLIGGSPCPTCGGPMVICKSNPRLMRCQKYAGCCYLMETPSRTEQIKLMQEHVAVVRRVGKKKGRPVYKASGIRGMLVCSNKHGDILAVHNTKQGFVPGMFQHIWKASKTENTRVVKE